MVRMFLLALLVGCTDDVPAAESPDAGVEPDAASDATTVAFEPSCSMTVSAPVPGPNNTCLSTLTVNVTCAPGTQQAHDRIGIAWARLSPLTGGYVETGYRCNDTVTATFTVVCNPPIEGGAAFQHPVNGGDIYADEGIACQASSP